MVKSSIRKNNFFRQKGLSLIEMMIALTLGSVVTVGVVQLFVANSQTYKLLNGQSRMQESARFAHEFIGRAVRIAGYKGCYSTNEGIITTLDPPDNLPYEFDLRTAIQGYNAAAGGGWLPTFATEGLPITTGSPAVDTNVATVGAGNGIDSSLIVPGTDLLTTRNMSVNEAQLAESNNVITDDLLVTIPANGNEIVVDHIVFIGDCEKGTLFRVTDEIEGTPTAGAGELVIGHKDLDAVSEPTRNTFEGLAEVNVFEIGAAVGPVESHTFFIAPGEGVNNLGNPVFSLWRKSGVNAPVELVEGVEDLQVLYGIDTTDDSTPNQYVEAFIAQSDWNQIVTVRVSVTVNSVDDVGSESAPTHGCTTDTPAGPHVCISGESYDGLLRRTFTQTIHLRNHG
jgi:type IV pilus assembly protein PilW